mmetsp:Transcript_17204/g.44816  ORF Transcript_17204/g.44816 Transcript_17204/m.44816 type:complete len:197 (-) Transcript_17204:461-1051(-)
MTKLRVANPAPQRVIFKVLSTNPPRYYVKPNGGVIAEGAVLDISFSLADTSGIGDKVDKFLVEWMWDSDFPEPIPQDVDGAVGWKAFFCKGEQEKCKGGEKGEAVVPHSRGGRRARQSDAIQSGRAARTQPRRAWVTPQSARAARNGRHAPRGTCNRVADVACGGDRGAWPSEAGGRAGPARDPPDIPGGRCGGQS